MTTLPSLSLVYLSISTTNSRLLQLLFGLAGSNNKNSIEEYIRSACQDSLDALPNVADLELPEDPVKREDVRITLF